MARSRHPLVRLFSSAARGAAEVEWMVRRALLVPSVSGPSDGRGNATRFVHGQLIADPAACFIAFAIHECRRFAVGIEALKPEGRRGSVGLLRV